jgi:hypothetical protein
MVEEAYVFQLRLVNCQYIHLVQKTDGVAQTEATIAAQISPHSLAITM